MLGISMCIDIQYRISIFTYSTFKRNDCLSVIGVRKNEGTKALRHDRTMELKNDRIRKIATGNPRSEIFGPQPFALCSRLLPGTRDSRLLFGPSTISMLCQGFHPGSMHAFKFTCLVAGFQALIISTLLPRSFLPASFFSFHSL
jgi:hypothetical protein